MTARASEKSAAAREREAVQAHEAWVKSLSPSERARIEKMDKRLLRPMSSGATLSGWCGESTSSEVGDFSDRIGDGVGEVGIEIKFDENVSSAARRFDELMACAPTGIGAELARRFVKKVMELDAKCDRGAVGLVALQEAESAMRDGAIAFAERLLVEVRDAKLAKFHVRVLLMATGFPNEKESMRILAKEYGYSATHVANLVEAAQSAHGLPKNQYNKSAAATATYQETNGR